MRNIIYQKMATIQGTRHRLGRRIGRLGLACVANARSGGVSGVSAYGARRFLI